MLLTNDPDFRARTGGLFCPPRGLSVVGITGGKCGDTNGYISQSSATVFRNRILATIDAHDLVLVLRNSYSQGTGLNLDAPIGSAVATPIKVTASFERLSPSGPLVTDQPWMPTTFSGVRQFLDDSNELVYSDRHQMPVASGEAFFARIKLDTTASNRAQTGLLMGGGGNAGDGESTGGNVYGNGSTSDTNQSLDKSGFRATALLGVPRDRAVAPGVALITDSLGAGAGDGSCSDMGAGYAYLYGVGFGVRAALLAGVGCVSLGAGGTKLSDWATAKNVILRTELAGHAPGVLVELGINDIGNSSTATMQANLLTVVGRHLKLYQNVGICTITPQASSSDDYATFTNQSPALGNSNNEYQRRNWNRWLRDATGAGSISGETPQGAADGSNTTFWTQFGFSGTPTVTVNGSAVTPTVADAAGGKFTLASAPANGAAVLVSYTKMAGAQSQITALAPLGAVQWRLVDIAAAIEYDASGNLIDVTTYNPALSSGGRWPIALKNSGSVIFATGTATGGSSAYVGDSALAIPAGTYNNAVIKMTSGSLSGEKRIVFAQHTGAYVGVATIQTSTGSGAVAAGDTYAILKPPSMDGTHPSPWVHAILAAAISGTVAALAVPN